MDEDGDFDTSNPMIARILQARQERMKMLQEMNKEYQDELKPYLTPDIDNKKKLQKPTSRSRKPKEYSPVPVRRSGRISNAGVVSYREDPEELFEIRQQRCPSHTPSKAPIIRRPKPPNDYGPMPGILVGHHWEMRMECSADGVHRPTVAGIHAGPEGAYSIALSGGYPEDVDEGYKFTYTGAGGRELKGTALKPKNLRTAPQTKDQELTGVNYSLVKSIETEMPIRVIRGYKSPSVYAPEFGYRYDGLYRVVRYWEDVGKTGFRVYRFEMHRIENQLPPPWECNFKEELEKYKEENKNWDVRPAFELSDENGEDEESLNDSDKENEENSCTATGNVDLDVDVDEELKKCEEKLCQNSVDFSLVIDSLKSDVEELSFYGWE